MERRVTHCIASCITVSEMSCWLKKWEWNLCQLISNNTLPPGSSPSLLTTPSLNIQNQFMSTTLCCINYNILNGHLSDFQKLMMESMLTSARKVPLYNDWHSAALGSPQCSAFVCSLPLLLVKNYFNIQHVKIQSLAQMMNLKIQQANKS